jgi:hypothetical protein
MQSFALKVVQDTRPWWKFWGSSTLKADFAMMKYLAEQPAVAPRVIAPVELVQARGSFGIVTEFAPLGSLDVVVAKHNFPGLGLKRQLFARRIFSVVADTLFRLHTFAGVTHGAIDASHVLVFKSHPNAVPHVGNPSSITIKLGGFSKAKRGQLSKEAGHTRAESRFNLDPAAVQADLVALGHLASFLLFGERASAQVPQHLPRTTATPEAVATVMSLISGQVPSAQAALQLPWLASRRGAPRNPAEEMNELLRDI